MILWRNARSVGQPKKSRKRNVATRQNPQGGSNALLQRVGGYFPPPPALTLKGEGMPAPERGFLRDLKNLDKRLGVKFNDQHFVVTYDRGHGEPVNILRVMGEGGSFRQPDKRDLMVIKGGDLAEGPKMDLRLKEAAYKAELIRQRDKRKAHENIRDMTKDSKNQLTKAFIQATNQSKGNATFRRIDHKPGKNCVAVA